MRHNFHQYGIDLLIEHFKPQFHERLSMRQAAYKSIQML